MSCDDGCGCNESCEPLNPRNCEEEQVPVRERECVQFLEIKAGPDPIRLIGRIGGSGTGIWNRYDGDIRLHAQTDAQIFQIISGEGDVRVINQIDPDKPIRILKSRKANAVIRLAGEDDGMFVSRPINGLGPAEFRIHSEVETKIIKNLRSSEGVIRIDSEVNAIRLLNIDDDLGEGNVRLAGDASNLSTFLKAEAEGNFRIHAQTRVLQFPFAEAEGDLRLHGEGLEDLWVDRERSAEGVFRLITQAVDIPQPRSIDGAEGVFRLSGTADVPDPIQAEGEGFVRLAGESGFSMVYNIQAGPDPWRLINEVDVRRVPPVDATDGQIRVIGNPMNDIELVKRVDALGTLRIDGVADADEAICEEGTILGCFPRCEESTPEQGSKPISTINATASGGQAEDSRTYDTGVTSGILSLTYNMYYVKDTIKVYYEGVAIYDSGLVRGQATVNIPYGGGVSTEITIVANEGSGLTGTGWNYQGIIYPTQPKVGTTLCSGGCDDEIPDMIKIRDDLVLSVRGNLITSYEVLPTPSAENLPCQTAFAEIGRLKKIDEVCYDDPAFGGILDERALSPFPYKTLASGSGAPPEYDGGFGVPLLQGFIPSSAKYLNGRIFACRRYQVPAQGYDAVHISVSSTGTLTAGGRASGFAPAHPRGGYEGQDGFALFADYGGKAGGYLYPKSLYSSSEVIELKFFEASPAGFVQVTETEYWVTRTASALNPEGYAGIDVYYFNPVTNQLEVRQTDDLFRWNNGLTGTIPPSGETEHGFRQIVGVDNKIFVVYSDEGKQQGPNWVPNNVNIFGSGFLAGNTFGMGDAPTVNQNIQLMFDGRTGYYIENESVTGRYPSLDLGKDKVSEADISDPWNRIIVHVQGNELQSYRVLPSYFRRNGTDKGPVIGDAASIVLLDTIRVADGTEPNSLASSQRISGKPWFEPSLRVIYYGTFNGGVGSVKMDDNGIFSNLKECDITDSIVRYPAGSPIKAFNRLYVGDYECRP